MTRVMPEAATELPNWSPVTASEALSSAAWRQPPAHAYCGGPVSGVDDTDGAELCLA